MAASKNSAALAGGYGLARSAADITVADNLPAVDELMRPFARAANLPSDDSNPPNQRIASDWCADLELTMAQFLTSVSLQDLVAQPYRLGAAPEPASVRAVVNRSAEMRHPLVVTATNSVFAAPRRLPL